MNNKGIALIVTLIVALLILILGSVAFYVSLKATKLSGNFGQYRASMEAINAGYEETRYIISYVKTHNNVPGSSDNLSCSVNTATATNFIKKIEYPTSSGNSAWTQDAQNPDDAVSNYDIKCDIGDFNVYVKLINTSVGNTAVSNKGLNAGGVTTGRSGRNNHPLPRVPYLYDIIVVSQSKITKKTTAVSILYGY